MTSDNGDHDRQPIPRSELDVNSSQQSSHLPTASSDSPRATSAEARQHEHTHVNLKVYLGGCKPKTTNVFCKVIQACSDLNL